MLDTGLKLPSTSNPIDGSNAISTISPVISPKATSATIPTKNDPPTLIEVSELCVENGRAFLESVSYEIPK